MTQPHSTYRVQVRPDFTLPTTYLSVQSDEARHAQIATPLIEILIRNGKKAEVQKAVDIAFWRIWKIFAPCCVRTAKRLRYS